ncbi:dnaJ homolog subfamily C member 1-like [Diadema antillarum]|uniref:dnaJ homolog subfamily C member 1-like n=1 Tax=Diadema antillarum TaxID=105358 RepID=UPI003A894073
MASSRRFVNSTMWNLDLCRKCQFVWTIFIIAFLLRPAQAWDSADLELFDLVEEVQQNFYDVLGLDQNASPAEIRRAYRRLTLQHHPDKNKEEDAEEKFRMLVAVSEVLRDEERRKKYDEILEHGLPDWRQPVFYYRRVRKMGLLELTMLLSGILTVGHYLVLWSMYFERKLELEALIKPKRIKKSKKVNRQASSQVTSEPAATPSPEDDPTFVPKPILADLLPWRLGCAVVSMVRGLPGASHGLVENWKARRKGIGEELKEEEDEEEEEERERDRGGPREKQRLDPALYDYDRSIGAAVTMATGDGVSLSNGDVTSNQQNSTDVTQNLDWSAYEVSSLVKCMSKYPGGTTDRWTKIATELNKPVDMVTKKAKQLKTQKFATNVDAAYQGITGGVSHAVTSKKSGMTLSDDITMLSASEWDDLQLDGSAAPSGGEKRRRPARPVRNVDRTLMIAQQSGGENHNDTIAARDEGRADDQDVDTLVHSGVESCAWTQRQQKILEKAMQVFPRGSEGRWDKIADTVPGKTKEECIARYKELVEIVKRKKKGPVQR